MSETVVPHSFSEAAAALAGAVAQGRPVRIVGGGTKLAWGGSPPAHALRLQTTHLSRVIVDDDQLRATINAGTALVRAQALLARSGLMLAADPHLGLGERRAATVGGVVATADSGPLSHRYGPLGEQVAGITAALSDGTLLRTGPRSDHQQDGYDPTRLMVGSFGTLGVILAVDVHLRRLPRETATALGATGDPRTLCAAAAAIAQLHQDLQALDLAWHGGRGGLLAQIAGDEAASRATDVAETMRGCGLEGTTVRADDAGLWARQRAGQRSAQRAVLRVHAGGTGLEPVLRLADEVAATVVGRAALGVCYLTLDVPGIARLRAGLPPGTPAVVLDIPANARGAVDAWDRDEGPTLELMRAIKARFDPAGICNPGVFVGGI